jgi:hypothetical protein
VRHLTHGPSADEAEANLGHGSRYLNPIAISGSANCCNRGCSLCKNASS